MHIYVVYTTLHIWQSFWIDANIKYLNISLDIYLEKTSIILKLKTEKYGKYGNFSLSFMIKESFELYAAQISKLRF